MKPLSDIYYLIDKPISIIDIYTKIGATTHLERISATKELNRLQHYGYIERTLIKGVGHYRRGEYEKHTII